MKSVAAKVSGSSTSMKPPKPMIEKLKKEKPETTMKRSLATKTTPSSATNLKDNDRVSTLKSRFASTILKAQQQLSQSEERARVRTTCIVEKKPLTPTPISTLTEEPRVAHKAVWRKKKPPMTPATTTTAIEELRKVARESLEELERSVEVEDNHKSVKDLERLCGWPIPYVGGFKNRMEYYGLYLKNY